MKDAVTNMSRTRKKRFNSKNDHGRNMAGERVMEEWKDRTKRAEEQ